VAIRLCLPDRFRRWDNKLMDTRRIGRSSGVGSFLLGAVDTAFSTVRQLDWIKNQLPEAVRPVISIYVALALMAIGIVLIWKNRKTANAETAEDQARVITATGGAGSHNPTAAIGSVGDGSSVRVGSEIHHHHAAVAKYSSTQTVERANDPDKCKDTINLDNVATMAFAPPQDHSSIGMMLLDSPQLEINEPDASKTYKHANFNIQFPSAGSGIDIRHSSFRTGRLYVFGSLGSPTHVIEAGARRFKVTLQSVKDKSSEAQKLLVYTFGISEE
jgi:hypothetical protein